MGGCVPTLRVRLGYLVSTHPGQGALKLTCHGGCKCRPFKAMFLRQYLPFPFLETDARRVHQYASYDENVTVTAYTSFVAELKQAASSSTAERCFLSAEHVASKGAVHSVTPCASRVRLDSLSQMSHTWGPAKGNDRVTCGVHV